MAGLKGSRTEKNLLAAFASAARGEADSVDRASVAVSKGWCCSGLYFRRGGIWKRLRVFGKLRHWNGSIKPEKKCAAIEKVNPLSRCRMRRYGSVRKD